MLQVFKVLNLFLFLLGCFTDLAVLPWHSKEHPGPAWMLPVVRSPVVRSLGLLSTIVKQVLCLSYQDYDYPQDSYCSCLVVVVITTPLLRQYPRSWLQPVFDLLAFRTLSPENPACWKPVTYHYLKFLLPTHSMLASANFVHENC